MSIIVTQISQHGIIHATDSNLTNGLGNPAGQARKLFSIKRLNGAMTAAGNYSVGGKSLDSWLLNYIHNDKSKDLKNFVISLTNALNQETDQIDKQSGYFFHIAGYAGPSNSLHPEFYHITNYSIDPTTGNYSVLNPYLQFSEDFWRQNSSVPINQLFSNKKGFIYCNGYPSGRIIYLNLLEKKAIYRSAIWTNPNWQFRFPKSVDEEAEYLKHDMEEINLFFKQSNYSAPFIGGPTQIYKIKSP